MELDPTTGPGCSSLGVGAFSENGPFRPSGEVLEKNEFGWNRVIVHIPIDAFFFYAIFDITMQLKLEN